MKRGCLAAQIEALEELQITLVGGQLQVVQQFAATGDQLEQATTGGVILRVAGEVLGEVIDTLRQKCDLHVGTSGVFIVQLESAVADSGFAHGLVSVLASRRRVVLVFGLGGAEGITKPLLCKEIFEVVHKRFHVLSARVTRCSKTNH